MRFINYNLLLILCISASVGNAQNWSERVIEIIESSAPATELDSFDLFFWAACENYPPTDEKYSDVISTLKNLSLSIDQPNYIDKYTFIASWHVLIGEDSLEVQVERLKAIFGDIDRDDSPLLIAFLSTCYLYHQDQERGLKLLGELEHDIEKYDSKTLLALTYYVISQSYYYLLKTEYSVPWIVNSYNLIKDNPDDAILKLFISKNLHGILSFLDAEVHELYISDLKQDILLCGEDPKWEFTKNTLKTFLAEYYQKSGNYEEAEKYFNQLVGEQFLHPDFYWIYSLYLVEINNLEESRVYYELCLKKIEPYPRDQYYFRSRYASRLMLIGEIDLAMLECEKINKYLDEGNELNIDVKNEILRIEREWNRKSNNWKKYSELTKKIEDLSYAAFQESSEKEILSAQLNKEISYLKKENLLTERNINIQKSKVRLLILSVALSIFVLMLAIGYLLSRVRFAKKLEIKNQLIKENSEKLLEQNIELKEKNRKIDQDFNRNLLRVLEVEKNIADIESSLMSLPLSQENRLLLIEKLNRAKKYDSFEELELHFEFIKSGFFSSLSNQFPSLTKGDLKICAFIYLNLDVAQMAHLRKTSSPAIKTAKSRLRKKLGVKTGVSLRQFLEEATSGDTQEL